MSYTPVLSSNDLRRATGMAGKTNKKIRWHDKELYIKPMLTLNEYISVIQKILIDCQSPDGEIIPDLVDFAVRTNIIASYAFVDLPKEADVMYYVVYASDLYDTIYKYSNKAQIDAINSTVAMYVR